MKHMWAVALIAVLGGASRTAGQSRPQPQQPSAELHRVNDYFVGTWKLTGETKASPFGPGGQRFASAERLEWMPGGFFLVAHTYEGKQWHSLTIIAYDANEKVFTHTSYNAAGDVGVMKGTAQDDTVIFSKDGKLDGKPVRQRMTIKKVSPALYAFTVELAPEGGNWSVVSEGKGMKTR